ncbi:MAG: hypothetical protein ACRD2W_19495 [Acidimicrobiales bacterium]
MAKRAAPNLFELAGGGTTVTWSPTSLDGKPQLTYDDGAGSRTFRGTEVRQSNSPMGKLVTVVLEATADLRTRSFSLVVPRVNLGDKPAQKVRTVAVLTNEETSLGGPDTVPGQVQSYQVVKLSGSARFVTT